MTLSPDVLAELIQPGTEEEVRRLHGRRFGTSYTYVIPLASTTIILVFPVHVGPERPPTNVTWGEVSWKNADQRWQCVLHNLPLTDTPAEARTLHLTLKQALWRARRHVIHNADPEAELVELPLFKPLESALAPEDQVYAYRAMVMQTNLHIPVYTGLSTAGKGNCPWNHR